MFRQPSTAELVMIEKGRCPFCGSNDTDDAICLTCQQYWMVYPNGRIELWEAKT